MKRAFTLLEILLVIIIIAILASIIFPVLAGTRDAAFKGKALVQSKQLGTAIMMYAEQSDGAYLPSTNYGFDESDPQRMWQTNLMPFVKSKDLFIAPGSNGKFPTTWDDRGQLSMGYNSATALDKSQGCDEDAKDTSGCLAFKTVAQFDKSDRPETVAMLAVTPSGPTSQHYRGYEFSPYNGVPNPDDPRLSNPLVSDRDLVKEMNDLPGDLIKPIYARYNSDKHDHGSTPVVFADGHVKEFTVKQITGASGILWRFR